MDRCVLECLDRWEILDTVPLSTLGSRYKCFGHWKILHCFCLLRVVGMDENKKFLDSFRIGVVFSGLLGKSSSYICLLSHLILELKHTSLTLRPTVDVDL